MKKLVLENSNYSIIFLYRLAAYLGIGLFLCSCNSMSSSAVEYYISAGTTRLEVPVEGSVQTIAVNANCDWKLIHDIPLWCEAKILPSDKNGNIIEVSVYPNEDEASRNCTLTLQYGDVSEKISIVQTGNQFFHVFPMNTYRNVDINVSNAVVCAERMFVCPQNTKKIYPGHILGQNSDDINSLESFDGLTYLPVRMSAFAGGKLYLTENVPSFESTDKMAQEIINAYTGETSSSNLFINSPVQYTSLKQLQAIGYGNLGISLDEITGRTSGRDKMKKRTGLIYTYSNELFSITMDYPEQLVEEDIDEDTANNMVYINSITYGRTAVLVVETDSSYTAAAAAVSRYMEIGKPQPEDAEILASVNAWLIHFGRDGVPYSTSGTAQLIEAYRSCAVDSPIIPLNFSVNRFIDHSIGHISFTFNLST